MGDQMVTAAGIKASAEVYNPTHVLVFGKSPVTIEDAFTGSKSRVDFDSLEGSARLSGWRIGRVSLIVEKPVWNDIVLDDRLLAKADHAEAHLLDLPELYDGKAGLAALGQYVEIDNLVAPGSRSAPARRRSKATSPICPTTCGPMAMPTCCGAGRRRAESSR